MEFRIPRHEGEVIPRPRSVSLWELGLPLHFPTSQCLSKFKPLISNGPVLFSKKGLSPLWSNKRRQNMRSQQDRQTSPKDGKGGRKGRRTQDHRRVLRNSLKAGVARCAFAADPGMGQVTQGFYSHSEVQP